jgi:hypothetical protein
MTSVKSSKSTKVPSVPRVTGEDVLDRVIASTPAPLLPGEAEADYVGVAARIVAAARPIDAIEEFLARATSSILPGRFFGFAVLRPVS